jgi:hypothetical protein
LRDPGLQRRNNVSLDWDSAWSLRKPAAPPGEVVDVRFAEPIPIRVTKLLAVGLDVSRAGVRRLVDDGSLLSKRRLGGKASGDFSFTIADRWWMTAGAGRRRRPSSPGPPARWRHALGHYRVHRGWPVRR